jgi:hypothetical protein
VDRYLISGAVLALIIEVTVLFADMRGIDVPFYKTSTGASQTKVIGEIEMARRNVRRRSRESIGWDKSSRSDLLHDLDSILTLSQSSASLKLKGDINLHLDENTLVILEARDVKNATSALHLRFSKGAMSAKSPTEKMDIKIQEWDLDASAGTELNVRGAADGKVDVEILHGEATIGNGSETKTLQQGSKINLSQSQMGPIEKFAEQLHWTPSKDQRVYSHHPPVETALQWQGSAKSLRFVHPDKSSEEIALSEDQRELKISLPPGSSFFTLVSDSGISESHAVSVLQAPVVRYFSPLPRDRSALSSDVLFSWSGVDEAQSYRLEISEGGSAEPSPLILEEKTSSPRFSYHFEREGDFYWRVIAVDEEGFDIPPYYTIPIFLVRNPLQAPSLNHPSIRAPAEQPLLQSRPLLNSPSKPPDSSNTKPIPNPILRKNLFAWLFGFSEMAFAAQDTHGPFLFEVQFDWSAVPDADRYVIEISRTPDFNTLIVSEETSEPRFIWKSAPLDRYYWRVAGAQGKRRGLFSQPGETDLRQVVKNGGSENGVTLRRQEPVKPPVHLDLQNLKPTPSPRPSPTPAPAPEPTPEPVAAEAKSVALPATEPTPVVETRANPSDESHWLSARLLLGSSYSYQNFNGDLGINGSMAGPEYENAELGLIFNHESGSQTEVNLRYGVVQWVDTASSSFQKNLSQNEIDLNFFHQNHRSSWKWGFTIEETSIVVRDGLESVQLEPHWIYGPAVAYEKEINSSNAVEIQTSALMGDQIFGLLMKARLHHAFSVALKHGWQLSPEILVQDLQGPGSASSLTYQFGFWLGYRW